jgi:predicted RNase H-like HicB family nuclease
MYNTPMNKASVITQKGINALVWKETDLFVAQGVEVDVASQGHTKTEALKNLEEAIGLYLEDEKIGQTIKPRIDLSVHSINPKISYA